jgi:endoglucanase
MVVAKKSNGLSSMTRRTISFSLCLVLHVSVLGLSGCHGSTGPKDTGSAPFGRLRVSNGKLLDGSGHQVVLKGLGLGALSSAKALGRWNEDYFANARDWGAKIVRLPVFPFTFREDPEQTLLDLDDAVGWCQKYDFYLIIDYHVMGNASQGQFLYDEQVTWEEIEAFWATVGARYADMPTVAFGEIYNEPASLDPTGAGWEFDDWSKHADAIVTVLRKYAPKTIPVVAGLYFAYDFSAGGDKPFSDPDIALSVHPYPGKARASRRAAWDANFGYLGDRYPIIFTEVGFDPLGDGSYRDDLSYGREIIDYAKDRKISWTAFVFYNEPGWPMPLFSDWETLTPTVSGLFFKDVLAGKDVEIAGTPLPGNLPDSVPDAAVDAANSGVDTMESETNAENPG